MTGTIWAQSGFDDQSLKKQVFLNLTRSYLKNWILGQDQGGSEFQPAGILWYVEDLKRGSNAEIGPKDFFEIASNRYWGLEQGADGYMTKPFEEEALLAKVGELV